MNIEGLKNYVKNNPKLECLYMSMQSLRDEELAKRMIGIKRSPNNLIVNNFGEKNNEYFIYHIFFGEEARFNGFCSIYRMLLMYLAYAEDMMLTPVVTIGKNTLYYDETIQETGNVFEYFFEPVSQIDSKSIDQSRRVVISKGADAGKFGTTGAYKVDQTEIDFLAQYQAKYISLKSNIKSLFWNKLADITVEGRTLGVHVRATDYNKGYNRHPVVVTPQEYLDKTIATFQKYKYEKVFLATDDETTINLFEHAFGDKLFYYKDSYRSNNGEAIHYGKQNTTRQHHKFYLGLEIIRDFYTLGYCAGLIAGNSNVSMCARIIKKSINEEYMTMDIIDKGINHNMHETRSRFNSMLKGEKKHF